MSIDWSKAPEGATHVEPKGYLMFYKQEDKEWMYFSDSDGAWCQSEKIALVDGDWCFAKNKSTKLIPRHKTLTQAVFNGLPPEYRWAVVDADGRAHAHKCTPKGATEASWWCVRGCAVYLIGEGYDTTDWQNSLIERQEVSNRVEQLRSIEEARQVEATLAERQNQYGDFKDVAHLSQGLQSLLSVGNFSDTQQEAIQMICSKLARLACGDADHVDSWHDIAGYATLVVKDLESGK